MTETWYDKSIEQIEKRFSTERGSGLRRADVPKIRRRFGVNNVYPTPNNSVTAVQNFIPTDYTSFILLVALAIAAIFEQPVAAGTIAVMLIVNYVAALVTFVKSRQVLNGMAAYSLPTAKVLRDGRLTLVNMQSLVPGDVIFLSAGDIVPADCRLFDSDGLTVHEGNLTKQQTSVFKNADYQNYSVGLPIGEQRNMAFASTVVTAGSARAIVVATGADTVASSGGFVKPIVTYENLHILKTMKKYCSVWSIVMLVLVFLLTAVDLFIGFTDRGIFNVFLTGLSLASASMAEFYIAFAYVIVGCGIFNAMKRRKDINVGALIKNTEKLEVLKDLDVLIIPKEGILTQNRSSVEYIYSSRKLFSAGDTERLANFRSTVLCGVISTGIYGKGLSTLSVSDRHVSSEEEAIIDLASRLNLYNIYIDRNFPIMEHCGVGGESLFETTLTLDTDRHYMAVCRGDVETLLSRCSCYTENGGIYQMDTQDRLEFVKAASNLAASSYKVIAVATGLSTYNNLSCISAIQNDLTFEGLIAIREPLQKNVAQTVSRCRKAGIQVIMTTDRYNEGDFYLASSVGLIDEKSEILTKDYLATMSKDLLRTNLPLYRMYCGLSTAQVGAIVDLFKAEGKKVGLLAGGIDGALLLKKADVGFAQSITISPKAKKSGIDIRSHEQAAYARIARSSGLTYDSEALKFISDIVVSDADEHEGGGFNAVVSALESARMIYHNLLRMIRYLTTTQLARIFLTIGTIFTGLNSLIPTQLIFSGLVIDFSAIIVAAFSRPPQNILQADNREEEAILHPLGINFRSAIFALFQAVITMAVIPVAEAIGYPITPDEFCTLTFVSFVLIQLLTLTELETDRSIFLAGLRFTRFSLLFTFGTLIFLLSGLYFPGLGRIFGMVSLGYPALIACAAVVLLMLLTYEIYKAILHSKS